MRRVFHLPLPAHQLQQTPRGRPCGTQTGDPIDHCYPFLARFLGDDMTPPLKDLREPGPITVAHEGRTRREMALLNAPMADLHRAGGLLTVSRGRERKDSRDIGAELRLVLFDDHDLIASLLHHGLGHLPLGQQGVHRAYPALHNEMVQDGLHLRDLIGCVVHRLLGQRQAQVVGQG